MRHAVLSQALDAGIKRLVRGPASEAEEDDYGAEEEMGAEFQP